MRAALYSVPGQVDIKTVDKPTPGKGQVLIQVEAAGLNPTDWKHVMMGGKSQANKTHTHILLAACRPPCVRA